MSFSISSPTRTARTAGLGTRAFFGWTRSAQTQANPFCLPLLKTEKAKRPSASLVSGSDRAMRRTSSWVATSPHYSRVRLGPTYGVQQPQGTDHVIDFTQDFLASVPAFLALSHAHDSMVTCRASMAGHPASKTPSPC